jgi:formylglycine-generating enzyme required for sulfatase activity
MNNTSLPIEQVLKGVVTSVKGSSKGRQEPWMEGSIEGDFCFGDCSARSTQQVAMSDDRALWESVKDSRDPNELKVYLNKFPKGLFADLANVRIGYFGSINYLSSSNSKLPLASVQNYETILVGTVVKDCEFCPEMVSIPSGILNLSNNSAAIKTFLIGKTEITQGQWISIMQNNPSRNKFCGKDCPVEQVSWDDIQEFIRRLNMITKKNYRLPSEAEWEYASRSGGKSTWSFGQDVKDLFDHAWFKLNTFGNGPKKVSLKEPNSFGLFDMYGNVWEWTQDCWNKNYYDRTVDSMAWIEDGCLERVIRGGSWASLPGDTNSIKRDFIPSNQKADTIGFRIARDN